MHKLVFTFFNKDCRLVDGSQNTQPCGKYEIEKMKEYLFSYGTLQKEKVQMELFGRLLNGAKDILKGYKLSTIEIKDESVLSKSEQKYHLIAILSKDNTDIIEGIVFEISEEELICADKYETDDYKRVKVVLASGKEAWIYVAV